MEKPLRKYQLIFNMERCKRCGICAAFCPCNVIIMRSDGPRVDAGASCVACRTCIRLCPDFAVELF